MSDTPQEADETASQEADETASQEAGEIAQRATDETAQREVEEREPTDLKWVGEATAAVIAAAAFGAVDIEEKRVSYRMLVDAGVNPGVAAKIRREHSLSWSFEAGDGLARRSTQVRGLGNEEAAWVAASSGDWERDADEAATEGEAAWVADAIDAGPADADPAETDGSGDPVAAETAWRERSKPTPVTDLDGVDGAAESLLADAGITSVRSLATADPDHVADVLDIDADRVTAWHRAARDERE